MIPPLIRSRAARAGLIAVALGAVAAAPLAVTGAPPAGAVTIAGANTLSDKVSVDWAGGHRPKKTTDVHLIARSIREAGGRIVNMGSVGSHLAIPFGGALCATKSAFRSLNDALRLELHPSGIEVVMIEPAAIRTPAVDKTLGTLPDLPPDRGRVAVYRNGYHLLLRDWNAPTIYDDIASWIDHPEAPLPSGADGNPVTVKQAARGATP